MAEDFGAAAFFHDGENRAEVVGIVEPDFERESEEKAAEFESQG